MPRLLLAPLLAAVVSTFPADEPKTPTESHPVTLTPGVGKSALAPTFSPKGTQVALTPKAMPGLKGFDHLEGHVTLGPHKEQQPIAVARSERGKSYDLLFIDADRHGRLTGETPLATTPQTVRDKLWKHPALAAVFRPPVGTDAVIEPLAGTTPQKPKTRRNGNPAGKLS
jgi:hypothetical protein